MAKKISSSRNVSRSVKHTTPSVELHRVAHFTFFWGIALAFLAGLFNNLMVASWGGFVTSQVLVTTFVFLGTIVGLFNLQAKETMPFLVAAIALMLAGIVNVQVIPVFGSYLRAMLNNIVVFVVPGAIILGMKVIWKLARD